MNKNKEVLVPNYGTVSEQDVANMNAQELEELAVFVHSQYGKGVEQADLERLKKHNRTATGSARILFRDAPLGKVDMIIINKETTVLHGMTKTDMLSKALRLNAPVYKVIHAWFKFFASPYIADTSRGLVNG